MLKKIIQRIPGCLAAWTLFRRASAKIRVAWQYRRFKIASQTLRPELIPRWKDRRFHVDDATAQIAFDRHYIYHTAWALRQLAKSKPAEHVDISSSLYFVALGSAVVPMRHLDYRVAGLYLDNLTCETGDLTRLPFPDQALLSLSCMHVIEHVGLGRYGEPINPLADQCAARELSRVLAPGGRLLFAAPVGNPGVCFNAHRIYSFEMICDLFPELTLDEWALIPDAPAEGLVSNAAPSAFDAQKYGCGCFIFVRNA